MAVDNVSKVASGEVNVGSTVGKAALTENKVAKEMATDGSGALKQEGKATNTGRLSAAKALAEAYLNTGGQRMDEHESSRGVVTKGHNTKATTGQSHDGGVPAGGTKPPSQGAGKSA